MKKFEYRSELIFDLDFFNAIGKVGWELVCETEDGYYIFKREIVENKDE